MPWIGLLFGAIFVLGACGSDGPVLASPELVALAAEQPEAPPVEAVDDTPVEVTEVLPATEDVVAGEGEPADVVNTGDGLEDSGLAIPVVAFVIGPDAPVLGVTLGTDATEAISTLVEVLGEPDEDSGWYQGCPSNGVGDDERLVQWGDLNTYYERSGDTESLVAWGFDLRQPSESLPDVESLYLPGGSQLGDPIAGVAEGAGLQVAQIPEFGIVTTGAEGYEIVASIDGDQASWGAFVPATPRCG